jgi:hypothetical protein
MGSTNYHNQGANVPRFYDERQVPVQDRSKKSSHHAKGGSTKKRSSKSSSSFASSSSHVQYYEPSEDEHNQARGYQDQHCTDQAYTTVDLRRPVSFSPRSEVVKGWEHLADELADDNYALWDTADQWTHGRAKDPKNHDRVTAMKMGALRYFAGKP